jgi:hypothetical protein
MGNGKTPIALGVIKNDPPPANAGNGEPAMSAGLPIVHATLVVVPRSLLEQWVKMIHDWLGANFTLYVYEGIKHVPTHEEVQSRIDDFQRVRMVLMTYRTVMAEEPMVVERRTIELRSGRDTRGAPSPLVSVFWRRIILDEAQTVSRPAASWWAHCVVSWSLARSSRACNASSVPGPERLRPSTALSCRRWRPLRTCASTRSAACERTTGSV